MPHRDPEVRAAYHLNYMRRRVQEPEFRQRTNATANARAIRIRRFLDAIKVERGCIDCGYRAHPAALDFDHIETKKLLVSSSKSIRQATEEMAKCEVRCANCHRIKTWEQRWGDPCKPDIFEATYEPA